VANHSAKFHFGWRVTEAEVLNIGFPVTAARGLDGGRLVYVEAQGFNTDDTVDAKAQVSFYFSVMFPSQVHPGWSKTASQSFVPGDG
jgi:hypothetical protein